MKHIRSIDGASKRAQGVESGDQATTSTKIVATRHEPPFISSDLSKCDFRTPDSDKENALGMLGRLPGELRNEVYRAVAKAAIEDENPNCIFLLLQVHPYIRREALSLVFHPKENYYVSAEASLDVSVWALDDKLWLRFSSVPDAIMEQETLPIVIYLHRSRWMSVTAIAKLFSDIFCARDISLDRIEFKVAKRDRTGLVNTLIDTDREEDLAIFFTSLFAIVRNTFNDMLVCVKHVAQRKIARVVFEQLQHSPLVEGEEFDTWASRDSIREFYFRQIQPQVSFASWMAKESRMIPDGDWKRRTPCSD